MNFSVIYSIIACFFWGLIFVVPLYLSSFACIDIVIGRFLAFGIGSVGAIVYFALTQWNWKLLKLWKEATLCALVMNLGYFTALTVGIRLSNASLVTLIVGLAPILIVALTGRGKNIRSILLWPSVCIFSGIVLMNVETLQADLSKYSLGEYFLGVFCGILALAGWTWYVIYNTRVLQKNPEIDPSRWTALIGVVTLVLAMVAALIRVSTVEIEYLHRLTEISFVGGSLILGLICSLTAFTLWNIASARLPSAISGQIAILESVFGLIFIGLFQQHLPTFLEIAGMVAILGGVWRGLYNFSLSPKLP